MEEKVKKKVVYFAGVCRVGDAVLLKWMRLSNKRTGDGRRR